LFTKLIKIEADKYKVTKSILQPLSLKSNSLRAIIIQLLSRISPSNYMFSLINNCKIIGGLLLKILTIVIPCECLVVEINKLFFNDAYRYSIEMVLSCVLVNPFILNVLFYCCAR